MKQKLLTEADFVRARLEMLRDLAGGSFAAEMPRTETDELRPARRAWDALMLALAGGARL